MNMQQNLVIGVDVGTGSARAGVFTLTGKLLGVGKQDIAIFHPQTGRAEQSSANIWTAVCQAVKMACLSSTIAPERVAAIAFDATCSLVLRDRAGKPLCLSHGPEGWDIMVWMDQRATAEAALCNATGAAPLAYVGGALSPEMQVPKLLWLKRNRPDIWDSLGQASDLADFLSHKATGIDARSVCTLTCKWTYLPDAPYWDMDFLQQIGLPDLLQKAALPPKAKPVGQIIGPLTASAAKELDLPVSCVVTAGLIDAHAGALASLGALPEEAQSKAMALIAGTSNCHMALSHEPLSVPGVWGPYKDAILDGLWLAEGGQTATGALLDYIVETHAGAARFGKDAHGAASAHLLTLLEKGADPAPHMHVLPDFLGNRSPEADPASRGMFVGLTFETPEQGFLSAYWAAACAIAYGTRAIIERLNTHGHAIDSIVISGGHTHNPLLVKLYADATGLPVILLETAEPVLLGSAMVAASALTGSLASASAAMRQGSRRHEPAADARAIHDRRYKIFGLLTEQARAISILQRS